VRVVDLELGDEFPRLGFEVIELMLLPATK
jgi:hypothetical protein